jgi:hypothetical protein
LAKESERIYLLVLKIIGGFKNLLNRRSRKKASPADAEEEELER